MLDISLKQLKRKPKKVGTLNGQDVFEMVTKGGYNMLAHGGKLISVSPHPLLSKVIARNAHPDIQFDELVKSDLDLSYYQQSIDTWTEITNRMK